MKTFADMTPKERAECVGMWCGYNRHVKGGAPSDFVIIVEDVNEVGLVSCFNPGAPDPFAWAPEPWMLTPRFDMPRAWTPGGEPPASNAQAAAATLRAYGEAARWDFSVLDGRLLQNDLSDIAHALESDAPVVEEELIRKMDIVKTDHGYDWS